MSDDTAQSCSCKVGRIIDRYDLADLDGDLVRFWTGRETDRRSVRELATVVNHRLLEAALDEAGIRYKDGEVDNTYRLLVDDEVSSGTKIQTRNELERESVPVEQVEADFVSHQTVYNHLTDCLDATLEPPSAEDRLERSRDKLGALQNRTVAVTNDTVDQLQRTGALDLGEFNVLVSVMITCEDCHQQYTIRELFDRGRCDCPT